jgi:hypothetical protein
LQVEKLVALVNLVPPMRRSLELLLYKVKAMLIEVQHVDLRSPLHYQACGWCSAPLTCELLAMPPPLRTCVCVYVRVCVPPPQNDSLGAFSMGNLKHRDLAGLEVSSQHELDRYDDDDDEEDDDDTEAGGAEERDSEDDGDVEPTNEDEMDL